MVQIFPVGVVKTISYEDRNARIRQGVVTPIDSVQTPAPGVKNWVKQSKPKIWKVKRSKAHRELEKVKGQAQ